MAQPWGRGHGEVQPLPVHDTRPAALTVSILPAWSLEVEMEIYFNDSLKPNCIQAAREREVPTTCGSTTVRRALKSLPETARQTNCLFSVGPDSRARCWLKQCGIAIQKSTQNTLCSLCLLPCTIMPRSCHLCLPNATAATGCSSLSSREETQSTLELGCPSSEPQASSYFREWPSTGLKDPCVFNSPVLLRTP